MTTALRRRWSDSDRYFGPFTYAKDSRWYRPLALVLSSGDADDYAGCSLRVSGFGHTLIVGLPGVLRPWRRWVDTSRYEWSKSPNGGYWDTHRRQFGFSVSEGFLQVFLGPQTHDSDTTRSWSVFLPWKSWRHVRRSFYGLAGESIATLLDSGNSYLGDPTRFEREQAIADATPSLSFEFDDFDGERITATTRIEEREWRLGEGRFKWLSWFVAPKVTRSLDLRFSSEVGQRKGSWKGGTVGHSIEMLSGELHEAAFRRYCAQNSMTFIGKA